MKKPKIENFDANHELTLAELNQLSLLCAKADGHAPKIYWLAMTNKYRDTNNNFCVKHDGKIIAMMAFFMFENNQADLVAMVHPDYRQMGFFKYMFSFVKRRIRKLGMNIICFRVSRGLKAPENIIRNLKAKKHGTEYLLDRISDKHESLRKNLFLKMKPAVQEDASVIAKLDEIAFKANAYVMTQHYMASLNDDTRKVWFLVKLGKKLGKIHVRFEPGDIAFIHDFAIYPKLQGKGYGGQLLRMTINQLVDNDVRHIRLEVDAANDNALNIYKKCDFKTVSVYDRYKLSI